MNTQTGGARFGRLIMSQDAVREQMNVLWVKAREELLSAMEGAPPDSIISGTEWGVREIQQRLARDCFQVMVQSKVDRLDHAPQGAFSPGKDSGATGVAQRGSA
jgi:hypothetical protein